MAPALRSSVSVMEPGTKRPSLRQNISLLDMGDTLGVGFVIFFWSGTVVEVEVTRIHSSISPGRFFAANEVKALLAHILVTYDIKFEARKQAPRNTIADSIRRVPEKANVMFRKRQK